MPVYNSRIAAWLRGLLTLMGLVLLATCSPRSTSLLRPNGVAIAPDGSLYVMDRGNYRVVHLSAEGQFLGAFGKFGLRPEQIHSGWDLAIDSQGNLYFGNMAYSEESYLIHDGAKVFSPDGKLLREIGAVDYTPDAEATNRPYGLTIDAQDRVYLADFVPNTLRVFTAAGEPLGTFLGDYGSGPGQFNGLNDIAVDNSRGLLYAVDQVNSRVQVFTLSDAGHALTLTYQSAFGEYGDGPGQFAYPQYIAIDEAAGRVYVSDLANERVQVFDSTGRYLAAFAPTEVSAWQAMGINVGSDGAVYVADAFNNAIWVFEPDGQVRARLEVEP